MIPAIPHLLIVLQSEAAAAPASSDGDADFIRIALLAGILLALALAPALGVLAFFPARCERVRGALARRPILSTLLGALNLVVLLLVIGGLGKSAAGQLPALLILVGGAFALLFGLAAVARELGERLFPRGSTPLGATSFGFLLLAVTALIPLVGVFLLALPAAAALGALALSFGRARASRGD
jgi:hypothetical protein